MKGEVGAFSLESIAYLTGLVTANNSAGSNSARLHKLIQIEPCFLPSVTWSFIKQMPHIRTKLNSIVCLKKLNSLINYIKKQRFL